jgi:hypothetical protein
VPGECREDPNELRDVVLSVMGWKMYRPQTPVASTAAAAAVSEAHTSSPSKDHPTGKVVGGGSSNSSSSYFSRLSEKTMERWRESSVMGGGGAAKKFSGSLAEGNTRPNVSNDATNADDAAGSGGGGGGGGGGDDNTVGDGGDRGDRSDRDGGVGSISQGRLSRSSSVASSVCRTERSVASTNYSGTDTASVFGGGSQRSSFKGGVAGETDCPSNPIPRPKPSMPTSCHPSHADRYHIMRHL